jgi:hypothetical protein
MTNVITIARKPRKNLRNLRVRLLLQVTAVQCPAQSTTIVILLCYVSPAFFDHDMSFSIQCPMP